METCLARLRARLPFRLIAFGIREAWDSQNAAAANPARIAAAVKIFAALYFYGRRGKPDPIPFQDRKTSSGTNLKG